MCGGLPTSMASKRASCAGAKDLTAICVRGSLSGDGTENTWSTHGYVSRPSRIAGQRPRATPRGALRTLYHAVHPCTWAHMGALRERLVPEGVLGAPRRPEETFGDSRRTLTVPD